MKYELSENEYLETLALVRYIFDASMRVMETEKAPKVRRGWSEDPPDDWGSWPDEKTESDAPETEFETKFEQETEVTPEVKAFGAERFDKGASVFGEFVDAWIDGLTHDDKAAPLPDVEQPDRGALIRDLANGPNVLNVLAHVGKCGGLTHAVDYALPSSALYHLNESERRAFVQAVATVICATSSLLFPELSDHYEHRDIYMGKKL